MRSRLAVPNRLRRNAGPACGTLRSRVKFPGRLGNRHCRLRRRRARNLFNITYEQELPQFLFCAAGHRLRSQGTNLLTSALFATMRSLPSNTNMAPTPPCLNSENSRCQPVMEYVGGWNRVIISAASLSIMSRGA